MHACAPRMSLNVPEIQLSLSQSLKINNIAGCGDNAKLSLLFKSWRTRQHVLPLYTSESLDEPRGREGARERERERESKHSVVR